MPANLENSAVATGQGKVSFPSNPKERQAKECACSHATAQLHSSHASRVIPKILQARPQKYEKCELPDVQAGFRKGKGSRDQIANIRWIIKKQGSSRKASMSALLTTPKPLTVWSQQTVGNS